MPLARNRLTVSSHLIRVRGLKLQGKLLPWRTAVAPYTGAWIETIFVTEWQDSAGRTLYGCVD